LRGKGFERVCWLPSVRMVASEVSVPLRGKGFESFF
jgi:hypothetical protein